MTFTFTPPATSSVPPTSPDDHPGNRLLRYYRARPEGVNVYLYKAGSLSAAQHGRVDETDPITLYDRNGVATTNGWEDIELVFWGGHEATVITAAQASALQAAGYTVTTGPSTAPPVITSLSPNSGVGGTIINILGTGLFDPNIATADYVTVTVDGIPVSISNAGVDSGVQILEITVPAHADGAVDVTVTTSFGLSTATFTFATPAVNDPPAITALSPTSGVAGVSVILTGTHFAAVTSVTFDGVSATYVINSATSITATAPAHADAATSVIATDSNGASNGFTFTYATPPAPVISSLNPASGVATTTVTINGTTFLTTSSVTVDGVSVAFSIVSATQVTFVAPTHIDGAVNVVLTTTYGSDGETFTYSTPAPSAPPVLTALTPSSSATIGGASVIITGTALDLTTQLTFDGVPISFVINSPTQITCTSPAHAAGNVSVIAQSNNGPSNTTTFVYADADPHPGSDLLLESNFFLLLEDGTSSLLLE